MMEDPARMYGGFFALLMTLGMFVTYIMILVAIWRGMKAHESIASSLKEIANKLLINRNE